MALSILLVLAGAVAYLGLPVAQYPEIAPPQIQIQATYPGADPEVLAETVATPIEEQVNGVENMLYMNSQMTNNGTVTITVTFSLGTNIDTAQVLVQNRVAIAQPRLPQQVQLLGVTTLSRLVTTDQFKQIIVKRGANGQIVYLADVARVELGAKDYSTTSSLDGKPAAALGIFQLPGSNALAASKAVREKMKELSAYFPAGLEYRIVYDPTQFVQQSIEAVFHQLV